MDEPSVLDYLKSLLTPWKAERIKIPELTGEETTVEDDQADSEVSIPEIGQISEEIPPQDAAMSGALTWIFPWKTAIALFLVFLSQISFGPQVRSPLTGFLFLVGAFVFLYLAYSKNEILPSPIPEPIYQADPRTINFTAFGLSIFFAILTFLTSSGNRFSLINITLLLFSLIFLIKALWLNEKEYLVKPLKSIFHRSKNLLTISFTSTTLLLIFASLLVIFFRFYKLDSIPLEMVSDHAEKYLDINDILNKQTLIFFPRNGGREALQFYMVAGLHQLFGNKYSFLTLKISTAIIGLLSLPFFYLIGKEIGNKRIGFTTFLFAGIAYWTNVVSRSGMRLPFYFFFTGVVLYFFIKGIHSGNRNCFLLSGLSLGLSLYGYSANRILPLLLICGLLIYIVHNHSSGKRSQAVWQFSLLGLSALIIFLPLLRYVFQDPAGYFGRMFSRLSIPSTEFTANPMLIFLDNNFKALGMFSWSAGVVWVTSIPDYPALDVISAGLFFIGLGLVIFHYIRIRHWLDLFLIVSIPLLMLPSTLSLAFPTENPNLHRTAGVAIPVFTIIGIAMDGIISTIESRFSPAWNRWLAKGVFASLFIFTAVLNYNLVFDIYNEQYSLSAQNTSEMGGVIRSFSETIGNPNQAWVMGYPHWADTRLVSIAAGFFPRDPAMFLDQLPSTVDVPSPKLFLVHPQDKEAMQALTRVYPDGWFQKYESNMDAKDFLIFFVPKSIPHETTEGKNISLGGNY